ncbi:MAG TPA: hypothetical protein VMU47_13620 [Caldimonas sp.]|nr:hypothetical protein [Caldimonas sp.]
MDDAERDRRGPASFSARQSRPQPVSRRIAIPRWEVPSDPTGWLVNFILLVVLCTVLMGLAAAALRQWRSTAPSTPSVIVAGAPLPKVLPSPERAAARSLVETTEALEREAREKAQREAEERREAAYQARLAEEDAARRTLALEARREREWAAYYKRPDFCEQETDSVNCANDFIRQRRAFEEQFAARNRGG